MVKILLFHLLICWSVFLDQLLDVHSYRSPDEYYFRIGKNENLYDTGTLPEGEDVTVYLFRDEPRSYFLPVDGQSSPVSITLVPCSSLVEWEVYFHAQENHGKRDSLEGDPLFLQEGKSGDSGDRQRSSASTNRQLHTFQGREMTTFKTNGHLPKGVIRLVLTSKESNSRVQILVSSGARQTDAAIPLLPDDAGIEVAANDKQSVTVSWHQSPSHKQWGQHIHYCVTFNPRRNYRTLCSVHADLEGEIPPEWPKYAGFGFRWEDAAKRRIAAIRRQQHLNVIRRDIHVECVGNRHWASATSLLANRRYHVDVFAINRLTNRSSTYDGTAFVTASRSPPLPVLKSGALTVAHVGGRSVGPHVTYLHELKAFAKKLVVFVQGSTCSRSLTVDLIYEGAVVQRQIPVHNGLRKLVLKNAQPGNYSVRLALNGVEDAPRVPVKMCVVGQARKCPYSRTPNNRVVNATANLSSCRSVTLQWPSADVHAKYCLYAVRSSSSAQHSMEGDDTFLDEDVDCADGSASEDDHVVGPLSSSSSKLAADDQKPVFCRVYKKTSPQRNGKKIVETIWDLKTKTKYKFRLQVVLKKGVVVDYEPVFVDTEDKC